MRAGLFWGTAINDTSQVTGAALICSDIFALPRGLQIATVAKLVRNTFMIAVIPLMALHYAQCEAKDDGSFQRQAGFARFLTLFVLGFLIGSALRPLGEAGIHESDVAFGVWDIAAWESIHSFINYWAVNLLVLALAGVGLSTNLRIPKGLGTRPFVVGLASALALGVVSLVIIQVLGAFVTLWLMA